jgi:hypothetical protein
VGGKETTRPGADHPKAREADSKEAAFDIDRFLARTN